MKKNLIAVIILALVLANLILTAILAFTIIPQTRKSNALIDQVCAAINLDLEGVQNKDYASIPIEDIEVYNIENTFTVNLRSGEDGTKYYAVFSIGLSINMQSEGYKTYGGLEGLAAKNAVIADTINSVVGTYTVDEFNAEGYKNVKDDILEALQSIFGGESDFIVGVNFSGVNTEAVRK